MTDIDKKYCKRCGRQLTQDEILNFGGDYCEECYWLEDDELHEEEF